MTVELHLWTMPVRGQSPRPALERILAPFRRENPGIDVRIWVVPWGTVWDRLMSALKGRHGAPAPDVLQLDGLWTGTLAHLGLLKEITPRLWEMERENFLPALWEFCRLPPTKRLFAAPWTLELRALHVRRGAPARAGLALADLSEWKGVETVLSLGARARARAAGNAWEGESLLSGLAPWVWTAGGSFLSEDGRHPTFLSPEALQGAALFRNLLLDGPSAGLWSAPLGSVREPGVSPIPSPRGPAGRFSCLGGQVLAMAAGTRHSEESWALFRHLLSPAAQLDYARAAGMLPPRLPGAAELLEGPELGLFQDELSRARTLPSDVLLGSFERLLQRRLAVPAREAAPWADWQAALDDAAAESEMLLSLYEPAAV